MSKMSGYTNCKMETFFCTSLGDAERKINEFIKDKEIIDIKINSVGDSISHYIFIIYRDLPELNEIK